MSRPQTTLTGLGLFQITRSRSSDKARLETCRREVRSIPPAAWRLQPWLLALSDSLTMLS